MSKSEETIRKQATEPIRIAAALKRISASPAMIALSALITALKARNSD